MVCIRGCSKRQLYEYAHNMLSAVAMRVCSTLVRPSVGAVLRREIHSLKWARCRRHQVYLPPGRTRSRSPTMSPIRSHGRGNNTGCIHPIRPGGVTKATRSAELQTIITRTDSVLSRDNHSPATRGCCLALLYGIIDMRIFAVRCPR